MPNAMRSIEGCLSDIGFKLDKTNRLLQMIYEQNVEATQLEPMTEDTPPGLKKYLEKREAAA